MKKLKRILTEITKLTNTMELDYPELYVFLDEEPITIPATKNPKITVPIMQDYLESLKQHIQHYRETRQKI
jgi:hypothetical protein